MSGKMNTVLANLIKATGVANNAAALTKKFKNDYCSGVLLTILLANVAGGATFTVKLQWVDPTDPTKVIDIPGAVTTALAANGAFVLEVYPGITVVANQTISQALGNNLQVVVTPGGAGGTGDVTVNAQLIE